ncbi:hypothetical protein NDU88_008552 [Pleurodeles waltl]|uniref:Uncharacterized protein n=1 Tax=Pleurodeles waltl TaxID=8319 RepID=A0AAV7PRW7_PLEWA|nr:hypothetical protein NDU88_008552 [Pleurodeles waltl]
MTLQAEVRQLKQQAAHMTTITTTLEDQAEDALLGFLERVEGQSTEQFLEQWVKQVLKPLGLLEPYLIECAHRALALMPPPDAPARSLITRLLNYRDRDVSPEEANIPVNGEQTRRHPAQLEVGADEEQPKKLQLLARTAGDGSRGIKRARRMTERYLKSMRRCRA